MSTTPLVQSEHLVNPELIKHARDLLYNRRNKLLQKAAFVPGGDPSMMGGAPGGGAPPPGGDPSMGGAPPPGSDPSMGGGAPPMDPSMMGGGGAPPMDPSMMGMGGGAPPPPPAGGAGGDPSTNAKLDQLIQLMQGGGVGGQSGMNQGGQIKPKIDVNVAIMQMSKMIARIADALGVKIPASEMIATPNDLTQMAAKQQSGGQQDAAMGPGGGAPPGGIGGIPPMPDMSAGPGASPGGKSAADRARIHGGKAYAHTGLEETMNKAASLMKLFKRRRAG